MKHIKVLTKKGPQGKKVVAPESVYAYESWNCSITDAATCSGGATDLCQYVDYGACSGSGTTDKCWSDDYAGCYSGAYDECGIDARACGGLGSTDTCGPNGPYGRDQQTTCVD